MIENNKTYLTLINYFKVIAELRNENVIINSKDFTSQIGEWIVEEYFEGKRAVNGIQKHWDVESPLFGKIQVKTHAKADGNKTRWSYIKKIETSEINFVVIIVFNKDYQLKEFYKAPWKVVFDKIREHKDADRIYWNDLKECKIELNELKKHKIFDCFLD